MTDDKQAVIIDTNVLIYSTVSSAPFHEESYKALRLLRQAGVELWISRQITREYLAVLTRPQSYSKPLDKPNALQQTRKLLSSFQITDENMATTTQLLSLIASIDVGGKQIHDTNIVASALLHNISHIFTFNAQDFRKFAAYIAILEHQDVATFVTNKGEM